jgi:hypothetical protein
MSLTASLGFEAKYWVALAIAVYPANRNTDIALGCSCHGSPQKSLFFRVKYSRCSEKNHTTSAYYKILTFVINYNRKIEN